MAENKQAEQATPVSAKKEPAFSLEQLCKNCAELFGVTQSTFAGATYRLKDNAEARYTVAEMKVIIEKWQRSVIKIKAVK